MQFRQTQIKIVDIPDMTDIVLQLVGSDCAAVFAVTARIAADRAQILRRDTAVQLQLFAMANRQRLFVDGRLRFVQRNHHGRRFRSDILFRRSYFRLHDS